MSNKILITLLVIIGVIIIGAGTYYFFMQNPGGSPATQNNPASENLPAANSSGPQIYNIQISNFAFVPSTLTIRKGDTVVWTNTDPVSHTVTSDSGSELNSALIPNGQNYSHTFNTAGTYSYHCSVHVTMKGQITVE